MPLISRISGPAIERDGQMVKPRAMVATCDGCGGHAPFLIEAGGKWQAWCGWRDGDAVCVRKSDEKISDLLQEQRA